MKWPIIKSNSSLIDTLWFHSYKNLFWFQDKVFNPPHKPKDWIVCLYFCITYKYCIQYNVVSQFWLDDYVYEIYTLHMYRVLAVLKNCSHSNCINITKSKLFILDITKFEQDSACLCSLMQCVPQLVLCNSCNMSMRDLSDKYVCLKPKGGYHKCLSRITGVH